MKLHAAATHLETFGVQQTIKMGIAGTAKAFRAVIDTQYSDKIGSIVREICTNAWDSHAAAGQTRTFFVHCPNELRPEFYVRDYGVGMSHEKIETFYSVLFSSDKTSSNQQHGMWGLGSKAPLAYSDSFTLDAYDGPQDGKPGSVRHYSMVWAQDGEPEILLQGIEESDEPTGVCVGLAVEDKDFDAFKKAIRNTAFGFESCFDSNIGDLKSFASAEPLLKGRGWRAFPTSGWQLSSPTAFYVRQGSVIYPLDKLTGIEIPSDHDRRYVLDVPIGAIEVTTSREAIQYTDRTKAAIEARLMAVYRDVHRTVDAAIADIPTVHAFFDTLKRIKPSWLPGDFVHKPSGLKEPKVTFEGAGCVFSVNSDVVITGPRWSYTETNSLSFHAKNQTHFFVIPSVDELLDRPGVGVRKGLWPAERRRLARLTRIFCEVNDLSNATFLISPGFTDEFWAATAPDSSHITVTVADLKAAVPRRRAAKAAEPKPLRQLMRGLALAKSISDRVAMTVLPDDLDNHVWVGAEEWRRYRSELWAVVERFGAPALLIVSASALKTFNTDAASVPHLKDWVAGRLKVSVKKPADVVDLYANLTDSSRHYIKLIRRVLTEKPQLERRIVRGKGIFTTLYQTWRPLVEVEMALEAEKPGEFSYNLACGLTYLVPQPKSTQEVSPKTVGECAKALASANSNTRTERTARMFSDTDDLDAVIDCILTVQRHFPSLPDNSDSGRLRKVKASSGMITGRTAHRIIIDDALPF